MFGKFVHSSWALGATLLLLCCIGDPSYASRICTFKGVVLDHGWRSMTVKSGNQCAEVNVSWRTKFIPNRRPCIGERVAVDFVLEDGFMKATKVVSLTPTPPEARCYPPPPPNSTVCRTVEESAREPETCPPPQEVCTTKPPAHVTDKEWTPGKKETRKKPPTPKTAAVREPKDGKKTIKPTEPKTPPLTTTPPETAPDTEKRYLTITGEVVASKPQSLAIRVTEEGEAAELVNIRVGLKTKFVPFRRPSVGEKVKVEYLQENGDKFGYTVQVIQ